MCVYSLGYRRTSRQNQCRCNTMEDVVSTPSDPSPADSDNFTFAWNLTCLNSTSNYSLCNWSFTDDEDEYVYDYDTSLATVVLIQLVSVFLECFFLLLLLDHFLLSLFLLLFLILILFFLLLVLVFFTVTRQVSR